MLHAEQHGSRANVSLVDDQIRVDRVEDDWPGGEVGAAVSEAGLAARLSRSPEPPIIFRIYDLAFS